MEDQIKNPMSENEIKDINSIGTEEEKSTDEKKTEKSTKTFEKPFNKEGRDFNRNRDSRDNKNFYGKNDDFVVEVLAVNRVSCTTAGGRKMSFRATVVVGDNKSLIGIGSGKSSEVPDAINKAEHQAKKHMFKVPMYGRTIMYDTEATYGATKILLKRAKNGTGFITCNLIKSILRLSGMENLVAKVYGSTNTNNIILALLKAIKGLETPRRIAARRGKNLSDILPLSYKNRKTSQLSEEKKGE
jgi:small subunit ribosomal protein S5